MFDAPSLLGFLTGFISGHFIQKYIKARKLKKERIKAVDPKISWQLQSMKRYYKP